MKNSAPYQVLFPLGILAALVGGGVWLHPSPAILSVPTSWIHARLMVGCFLWSFVTGFLMTAIPRMTGMRPASTREVLGGLCLLTASGVAAFVPDGRWFQGTQILLVLWLILFGLPRAMKTMKPVPVFFSHVFLALLLALVGRGFAFAGDAWMGFFLADTGVLLLLVLGIGTRFYSFLSGLPSEFEQAPSLQRRIFHGLGVVLSLLLVLAGWLREAWVYGGLFLVALAYLLFVWRIFRRSARSSALKWGVRLVALSIPLSFLVCAWRPEFYLAGLHLLFVGAFGLITFAVASRVILAHGSYSLEYEMRSRGLWVFLGLLTGALVLRFVYGVAEEGGSRDLLLRGAASLWVMAIAVWCRSFAVKIFRKGDLAKPSC